MATLTAATIARREARKAVKAHYAAKGIRLAESQARFIWSIGLSTDEYTAIREALALGQPHQPVVRASRVRKATTQVSVTARKGTLQGWEKAANSTSNDYRSHIAKPGGRSAWVATDGTFYAVTYAGHHAFSMKCAEAGIVQALDYGSAVGPLEDKGWVHISGGAIVNRRSAERITPEQAETLMAWGNTDASHRREVQSFLASA